MRIAASSEPLIIGGGPAGSAAAIALARAGRAVTLIERSSEASDKVCGDFLSPEAVDAIEALGVDLSLAPSIGSVRLVHRDRVASTSLPFVARSLTRRRLDEALLCEAERHGARVLRGHRVSAIEHRKKSLRLECASLGALAADTVLLATGKHELRGATRSNRGAGLVALKMYYALDPRQLASLQGCVELVLFAGGYAGLQPVENGQSVLCALVSAERLRAAGGGWDRLLATLTDECPHLRQRLAGARPLLERPLAVTGLPYGYMHMPSPHELPGLYRLGDQAAVIPSFTGDGVALALAGGGLAAEALLRGLGPAQYHRRLRAALSRQMRFASVIHRLCLSRGMQPWLAGLCRVWPEGMRVAASWTRAKRLTHTGYAA